MQDKTTPGRQTATITGVSKGIGPGITDTGAAAWAAGEQEGGAMMLEFSDKYLNTSVPMTEPRDQAYAALYLASEMGKTVTGQVIQADNSAFL